MKLILSLLTLLCFLNVNAQHINIERALKSIQEEGLERGVDFDSLLTVATKNGYPVDYKGMKIVDTILVDSVSYHVIGVTRNDTHYDYKRKWHYDCTVEIEREILGDYNVAENVVAHELGHVLGLNHDENENSIMFIFTVVDKGFFYNATYEKENKEYRWDKYFNKLKTKYKLNTTQSQ